MAYKFKYKIKKREEYLRALRSGEYPQALGGLKKLCGYCAVGVYADVVDSTRWSPNGYWLDENNQYWVSSLPEKFMDSALQGLLMEMNDWERLSFEQIADWVEANTVEK